MTDHTVIHRSALPVNVEDPHSDSSRQNPLVEASVRTQSQMLVFLASVRTQSSMMFLPDVWLVWHWSTAPSLEQPWTLSFSPDLGTEGCHLSVPNSFHSILGSTVPPENWFMTKQLPQTVFNIAKAYKTIFPRYMQNLIAQHNSSSSARLSKTTVRNKGALF